MTEESTGNTRPDRRGSLLARWLRHLPEGLMVLLGVMLAFLMEEYREDREREQLAAAAMQRVNLEVANNFREVIAMHASTRERLAQLESLKPAVDDSVPFIELIPGFKGYYLLPTDRSAWSGMQLGSYFDKVPHAYLADVFLLYDSNQVLKSLDGKIRDLVFGPDVHDPAKAATLWAVSRIIMKQQVMWGSEAIPNYCRFLEEWAPELYARRQDEHSQDMPSFREVCS